MKEDRTPFASDTLPYTISLIVAGLMVLASLAGIFFPAFVYPAAEQRRAFLANDVANLLIGLPILLGSLILARRGSLAGLLFWPGALLYTTYNYLAYAVAMPLTWQFVPFAALVVLSIYGVWRLLKSIDAARVQERLQGRVAERFTGGMLVAFGLLVILLAAGKFAGAAAAHTSWAELSTQVADLVLAPAWLAGGIFLWQKKAPGYVSGAGLLFRACMLFIGLFIFFALQPLVAGLPFPLTDFVVIAVMSLLAFVPFGLFLRGVLHQKM
jgi:membrane protein implicated in regulation of membrane protease activity